MIIYLVRHGKDYEDYRGGWSNLGLIEEGINQSKKLAEHLYNNKDKYNINTLISSDLRRTVETINEISIKLNIPIKLCEEWREIAPNVMLVTHGGVIEVIYYIISGLNWTNKSAKLCESSNTGIHSIEYISGEWKIIDSNNLEHLNDLII